MTAWAYFEGEIRPIDEAKVSVMTHALHYGTGLFGGIRAYWNKQQEQLYIFRLRDHYRRFLQSARFLMASVPETVDDLARITVELLAREGWRQDVYIRPYLYKADETIGVRLHNLRDAVTIFSIPMGKYIQKDGGCDVGVSSWRRVDDTALPARGKLAGSYVNSALVKTEAVLNGFDEAIVLNQDGHVAEASAANLMIVRDGVLITPPVTDNILEGIVRRTLLELAREELGVPTLERSIDRTELYICDEAFFCGTGVQMAAIRTIDHRTVGIETPGPITQALRELFFRVVRGETPEYAHWLTPVVAETAAETAEEVAAVGG